MQPKTVGEVTVTAIVEHAGPYRDPLEVYPTLTPEIVARHRAWMVPDCMEGDSGKLIFAFQSFVIRLKGLTVLVDACVGEDKERPHRPNWHRKKWPWMDNLRAAGVAPEDIDVVMCTHLHVDHVGWNTRLVDGRWVPTFPNARYVFAETEFRHWESCYREPEQDWIRDAFEDSVLPVVEAGKADLVATDHEIAAGLWLEHTPGHTPGAVCLNLQSGGDRAVFCGDLMHHPLQVPEPQLHTIFCLDPALSSATRTAFVERHADTGTLIMPAHFADETAGRIVDEGGQCRFRFDGA